MRIVSFCRGFVAVGVLAACSTHAAERLSPDSMSLFVLRPSQLRGVTAYDPVSLLNFAKAHNDHADSPGTARTLADVIATIYREDGYLLAEVAVVKVDGSDEVIWQVFEGHIERVEIDGVSPEMASAMHRYLAPLLSAQPLRQDRLERALALAGDLAGVRLSSKLSPLPESLGSLLTVTASQTMRLGSIGVDFVPMKPGYAQRLSLTEQRHSVVSPGDRLRLNALVTRETDHGQSAVGNLFYRRPVGTNGSYVEGILGNAVANRGLSNTPERTELKGFMASLAWGFPVQRDLHRSAYVIGALEHSDSTARLGVNEPKSKATAVRLYMVRSEIAPSGQLRQYSLAYSMGKRPTTGNGQVDDGDERFAHLRGGFGLSGPFTAMDSAMSYRIEGAWQWTQQPLPRVEKTTLGHYPYLRGYAPAEAVGDRGAAFTAELVRHGSVTEGLSSVRPFVFVSGGRVTSKASHVLNSPGWTLASLGVGVRVPIDRWLLESWVASALKDGPLTQRANASAYLSLTMPW